jgi:hypothetical protein
MMMMKKVIEKDNFNAKKMELFPQMIFSPANKQLTFKSKRGGEI